MLRDVLAIVEAEGWFDSTLPFEKTIYLSQGSSQCVLLSRNGKADTFVKFTDLASLATEAMRCGQGAERFPEHAPRFVGYAKRPPLEVLATRAVSFRPLASRMMLAARDRAAIHDGLERFFQRMREGLPSVGDAQPGHAWFVDMCAYYDGHSLGARAGTGLQLLRATLETLPPLPQHGDLVLNNLGLRPDCGLVVFDWEDYAAINLPGLDLFTLENSIHQDLELQSLHRRSKASPAALDSGRMCEALGLKPALYTDLRLSYALVFRYLKRNYNQEVRTRIERVIDNQLADRGIA